MNKFEKYVKNEQNYSNSFHKSSLKSSDKYYKIHKRSMFSPVFKSEDNGLCLAVAIVFGIAHSNNDVNRYTFLTYYQNYEDLVQEVRTLSLRANVDLKHGGSIDQIIQFQQFLGAEYRIIVYGSRDGKVIHFKACHDEFKYSINMLLNENHFSLVLCLTAVFATSYFCKFCCVGYSKKLEHSRCRAKCNKCFQSPPCKTIVMIKCNSCKRDFGNATCLLNHISHGRHIL